MVQSLHGRLFQEAMALYCEESHYYLQGQAQPCSPERHGYALPRVTFVRLLRKPNGSTSVSSYSGVNAMWRRSGNPMVRRASPLVAPL